MIIPISWWFWLAFNGGLMGYYGGLIGSNGNLNG
jgi:hypothetical protein